MDIDPSDLNRSLPLRDQIYQKIRGSIVSGRMKPGQPINEIAIAKILGVSRTPVREAVKRIFDEGLITVAAQAGTFVAPISQSDLEGAYVIRRALEVESVKRAAERMTLQDQHILEDNIVAHAAAIDRGLYEKAIQMDDVFHRSIADISDLPMLWRAVDISKAQMDRCRYLALPQPGYGAETIAQHRVILEALGRKDGEAAVAAMTKHLETSLRNTVAVVSALA